MTRRQSWPFEEKFIPPDWNERVSRQLPWRWAAILEIKTHEMSALCQTLCALLVSCGFVGSAVAATATPPGSTSDQNAAPSAQAPTHLSQKLRDDLGKAGFTDITIMPSSFLVRAKDAQGNPVMMVINPDSVTEVTQQAEPNVSGAIKGAPNSAIPSPPQKPGTTAAKQ
jgi:hypothetical protein